jgi:hypothetical protein
MSPCDPYPPFSISTLALSHFGSPRRSGKGFARFSYPRTF